MTELDFRVKPSKKTYCSNCKAYHSPPRNTACPIPMGLSCTCCEEPVEELSTGGNRICGHCDTGVCQGNPFTGREAIPKTSSCTSSFRRNLRRKSDD